MASTSTATQTGAQAAAMLRRSALDRLRLGDSAFHWLTYSAALLVLLTLGSVTVSLVIGALPAIKAFGLGFLVTESWNPVTEKFGGLAPIYGTCAWSAGGASSSGSSPGGSSEGGCFCP